jgi:hypothetical protein
MRNAGLAELANHLINEVKENIENLQTATNQIERPIGSLPICDVFVVNNEVYDFI